MPEPLHASPDPPLVFSTSHGALASTADPQDASLLDRVDARARAGAGTVGVCASAATAMNAPASAAVNPFVALGHGHAVLHVCRAAGQQLG